MTYWFMLVAILILSGLAIFQFVLIFGAPLGKFAWGGGNKILPVRFRVASFISIILYAIFTAFIASKAGLINFVDSQRILNIGMWLFTVYFFIGIGMNAISRSKAERNIMTPLVAMLAISFLIVTLS